MADAVALVKRAAVEAVEAGKPMQAVFGTVVSALPLKIQTDQKAVYTAKMLILTRTVTDHSLTVTVEEVGVPPYTRTISLRNGLRAGERVVLLRVQGGRRFLVLDRVRGD